MIALFIAAAIAEIGGGGTAYVALGAMALTPTEPRVRTCPRRLRRCLHHPLPAPGRRLRRLSPRPLRHPRRRDLPDRRRRDHVRPLNDTRIVSRSERVLPRRRPARWCASGGAACRSRGVEPPRRP